VRVLFYLLTFKNFNKINDLAAPILPRKMGLCQAFFSFSCWHDFCISKKRAKKLRRPGTIFALARSVPTNLARFMLAQKACQKYLLTFPVAARIIIGQLEKRTAKKIFF